MRRMFKEKEPRMNAEARRCGTEPALAWLPCGADVRLNCAGPTAQSDSSASLCVPLRFSLFT